MEDPVALQHEIAKYAEIEDRGSLYGCGGCGTGLVQVLVLDGWVWVVGEPGITCVDIGVVLRYKVCIGGLVAMVGSDAE